MTQATEPVPTADEAFGRVIHMAMFDRRISQTKLAASLGISQSTLSKRLRGERPWSLTDTIQVADALRMDLRDLLGDMWGDPGTPSTGLITHPYPALCVAEFDGTKVITDPLRPHLELVA